MNTPIQVEKPQRRRKNRKGTTTQERRVKYIKLIELMESVFHVNNNSDRPELKQFKTISRDRSNLILQKNIGNINNYKYMANQDGMYTRIELMSQWYSVNRNIPELSIFNRLLSEILIILRAGDYSLVERILYEGSNVALRRILHFNGEMLNAQITDVQFVEGLLLGSYLTNNLEMFTYDVDSTYEEIEYKLGKVVNIDILSLEDGYEQRGGKYFKYDNNSLVNLEYFQIYQETQEIDYTHCLLRSIIFMIKLNNDSISEEKVNNIVNIIKGLIGPIKMTKDINTKMLTKIGKAINYKIGIYKPWRKNGKYELKVRFANYNPKGENYIRLVLFKAHYMPYINDFANTISKATREMYGIRANMSSIGVILRLYELGRFLLSNRSINRYERISEDLAGFDNSEKEQIYNGPLSKINRIHNECESTNEAVRMLEARQTKNRKQNLIRSDIKVGDP